VSYRGQEGYSNAASVSDNVAEICLIFELLDCKYCLLRELRKSNVKEMLTALLGSKQKNKTHKLRPVHILLQDNFNVLLRTGNSFVEMKMLHHTEQVAWMGILGSGEANTFAIHNRLVFSSLFTSSEE
jgi:hypothetical protein